MYSFSGRDPFPYTPAGPLRHLSVVAWLFAALALAAAPNSTLAQEPINQPRIEFSGRVLSSGDGSPVSAAAVRAEGTGLVAFSDATGRFRFSDLSLGEHRLAVTRLGFAESTVEISVTAGAPPAILEIYLTPEPVLVAGVVVTASGEFQRRVETPASISGIAGERIREVNPTHPFEIMNRIPGVWVSPTSTEGHMTSIRQPITTNPVYLFLEDGVPTRSPGFFNHNALYEVNVPHADRIEVIRGPGTALYGSDAIGGVIDVGTRPPSPHPVFEGSVEVSSLGFRRALGSTATTRGDDGFRVDLNLTEGDDWRDNGDYDRQSVTLRWDRAMSDGMSLRTTATYTSVFQSDPSVLSWEQLREDSSINTHPITYRSVDAFRLQSQFQRRTGMSLLHVTPYVRWNQLDLMPSWMLGFDPVIYVSGHTSVGAMARYNRDLFPIPARLTVGLDVDRSPGSRTEDRITVTREGGIAVDWERGDRIYDYSATYLGVSPYIQLQYEPISRLHLTGGLRYDRLSFDYVNRLGALQTGRHRRPADTTVQHSNLGPSLGGALTLVPELNLFAGFRESFRSPSEGQLFRQGSAQSTVDLNPVRARSTEAGIRGEVSGRVAYEISAYRMEVRDDILSFVRPEDGLTESLNAGRSRHQGVEVGLTLALPLGIQTDVSMTQASHRFVEWSPRSGVEYDGNMMPQAPRNLASARLRSPLPLLNSGLVELEWMRMGRFWMDPENQNAYGGHEIWNLGFEAPIHSGLAISGRVTNLSDGVFAERASFNAFRGAELSPGKPRTVQIGLRYGWHQ